MTYRDILYDVSDHVATITLNRPHRMNALTPMLLDEMGQAIGAARGAGARAILLTGAGDAFCSGADLRGDGAGIPADLGLMLDRHYHPVVTALAELDIPVVSAINGPAVGAGLSFALAADIVVMARSSYLQLAFSNIGLVPDAGATWLIARSAGRAKTLEMALLGERLSAEQALDYGLVTRLADDAELMNEARSIAVRLARGASVALGLIRRQVAAVLDATLVQTLEIEKANQTSAGKTLDFREAVHAFAEKRKPQFRGE